ncbi:MAG: SUMF1/EgtB/PvdO family nonheme iron enzyme [Sandaracinus sp.]|nr:SUMF1/EgtB/PvdO family nonheme iron enzyme [Sandaracinus sp.]MCB9620808.1 SUMF1/EgtB/PvdO family nonheme iron enzyme [Sandaracinus sp.]MCB9623861.1 SUMF1/EgtB/PvdO family nonheme iron enzyme [Sandaracinus sp.]MCB9634171.1 SUMF1/EgtB/PvdO family nonheme iron enzyme [Sandaracinus sp.]
MSIAACSSEPAASPRSEEPARSEQRTPPSERRGPCPERMALVPHANVCIDRWEARIEDGRAEARPDVLPSAITSWNGARAACEAAGYRLCTVAEWQGACAGPEDGRRVYPYGDTYEPGRCNTAEGLGPEERKALDRTGQRARCVSPEGVFDLSGNAYEWMADSDSTGMTRALGGGNFSVGEEEVVCIRRSPLYQPPDQDIDGIGFRCCTEPS